MDWLFGAMTESGSTVISEGLSWFSDALVKTFGTDLSVFKAYFPVGEGFYGVMQTVAVALIVLLLIWGLVKNFAAPLSEEADAPLVLLARCAVAVFGAIFALEIFEMFLKVFAAPYTFMQTAPITLIDGTTLAGRNTEVFQAFVVGQSGANLAQGIISLLLLIAIGWNYIKLALEAVERYVVIGVLAFTSPLGFSMAASKSTKNIFDSWVRMCFAQAILLLFNLWFLRGFDAMMAAAAMRAGTGIVASGDWFPQIAGGGTIVDPDDGTIKGSLLLWSMACVAFLKVGQRMDTYLASLGLSTAYTGGMLAMEIGASISAVKDAAGGAGKIAKAVNGGGKGPGGGASDPAKNMHTSTSGGGPGGTSPGGGAGDISGGARGNVDVSGNVGATAATAATGGLAGAAVTQARQAAENSAMAATDAGIPVTENSLQDFVNNQQAETEATASTSDIDTSASDSIYAMIPGSANGDYVASGAGAASDEYGEPFAASQSDTVEAQQAAFQSFMADSGAGFADAGNQVEGFYANADQGYGHTLNYSDAAGVSHSEHLIPATDVKGMNTSEATGAFAASNGVTYYSFNTTNKNANYANSFGGTMMPNSGGTPVISAPVGASAHGAYASYQDANSGVAASTIHNTIVQPAGAAPVTAPIQPPDVSNPAGVPGQNIPHNDK